jgi:hypothetical protein
MPTIQERKKAKNPLRLLFNVGYVISMILLQDFICELRAHPGLQIAKFSSALNQSRGL